MNKLYKNYLKRLLDIIFCVILLPFFLIILIIIAPLIWFEDKGPIFYNAPRIGKKGKIFKMYKFRSMKVNAPDLRNKDGSTYNSENDERLTKIGKFIRKTSIDELPQILNVLFGDMSFIGPRPYIVANYKGYNSISEKQKKRLEVRPGITGYSQAYFRNSISVDQKEKNDIFYVNNLSCKLDIKILIQTIKSVVKNENIYIK